MFDGLAMFGQSIANFATPTTILYALGSSLLGLINAPATKVAGVLQAPAGQLARVFNAYATKDAA